MKAKTLALTAIICGASIFGLNLAPVYAAAQNMQISQIEDIQTEQKSKKVRDRNRAIGVVLGIAAIVAIANQDKHGDRNRNEDYNRGSNKRTPPPPPPMPNHHR